MDEVQERLRGVFRTQNEATLFLPGTGTSGMEAALVNLLEPGDVVVAAVAGYFGARLADIAGRQGAVVHKVEAPCGAKRWRPKRWPPSWRATRRSRPCSWCTPRPRPGRTSRWKRFRQAGPPGRAPSWWSTR